jgi:hypothetical protein
MYIYDHKLLGPQAQPTEQPITSWSAQHSSYCLDRGISGFGKRGESSGLYLWTNEDLGEICVSPSVSSNDPTALNLSPVGTSDFDVIMDVRGTRYQVKGNIFYPGERSGASVPFNSGAVAEGKAPIAFIAQGQHATFRSPDSKKRADECGYNTADCSGYVPIASYKGYEYFQELLARMGIISVSVDCNEFSGDKGLSSTNINDRANLILGAIKHFQSLHLSSDPIFGGHIDFSSVGLMGHSRGGEAMLVVAELLAQSGTDISGVTVKGVLTIAPTDSCLTCGQPTSYGCATTGKPTGFAFMTILPAADADIPCTEGARFYDQASAKPFKCQLYVHNANHNFFNTEWILDDRDTWNLQTSTVTKARSHITLMSKDEQKAILKAYGCAFYRAVFARHNRHLAGTPMRRFLEGLEIPSGVTRFKDVHISFECFQSLDLRRSLTVDDNEGSDIRRNTRGQINTWAGGLTAQRCEFAKTGCRLVRGGAATIDTTFYGNTRGMVARSSLRSGRFKWVLGGTMDLSGREIRLRAAEVYNGSNVPARATGFKLGLADVRDKRGFVDSDDVGGLPLPYDRRADDLAMFGTDFTKTMLKTLRFPVSCIASRAERGFDVTKVRTIVLWMDRNDGREIAFDQLQIV